MTTKHTGKSDCQACKERAILAQKLGTRKCELTKHDVQANLLLWQDDKLMFLCFDCAMELLVDRITYLRDNVNDDPFPPLHILSPIPGEHPKGS